MLYCKQDCSLSFITILHRHIVRYAITLVRKKNWPPYNVCFHRLSKLREPLRYLVIIITETMSVKVSNYFSIEFISTFENSYIKENTKLTFLSFNHQISHCYILHLCQLIGISPTTEPLLLVPHSTESTSYIHCSHIISTCYLEG